VKRGRLTLIQKIKLHGLPADCRRDGRTPPLASVKDFFTGNDDNTSIARGLPDHPGVKVFFDILLEIKSRADVQDVMIEIDDVDESSPDAWPRSDRIYIVTAATQSEVEGWLAPLRPLSVSEGFAFGLPSSWPTLRPDMNVFGAHWK